MTLSSADFKRQILMSAKDSAIRKKLDNPPGIDDGKMMDMGNKLEAVTRLPGWILIEAYMFRQMDLIGLALSEKESPDHKGIARAFIELMQWIQLCIEKKDELIQKEKLKYETKNVQKNETDKWE